MTIAAPIERHTSEQEPCLSASPLNIHVTLLTNFIPPYAVPVYVELAKRVRKLTILLSTPMESNRRWKPDWATLDVRVQRTLTLERPWRHPTGFNEPMSVHLPLDTISSLRRLRPDVVVSAQFGVRSLLSACYASLTRTPLVLYVNLSEHQELSRGWIRHRLRRWLIRRASCIAVNGRSGARYLQKLGASDDRLFRVPYVALENTFNQRSLDRTPSQAHRLLYAGQLIERKGLVPFIEALVRWAANHPDRVVELDIAGYGPLETVLESLVLPNNVKLRLLGEHTFVELADLYSQAGILVLPTLSDEWGLVVNEALAAGLPVLGSVYSQAVEDLCIEGETGWRFRTDVPEEMDAAIARALDTPADRLATMRRAGRDLVKHLTPAYAADRFVTAIQSAVERSAARSAVVGIDPIPLTRAE